ncbi:MAG: hypothetical protein C4584_02035 [Armatimonadetes bacterium]|nr:MAG: hypothetical protein C4584_02035 [Armatimonadota bacterium]
MKGLLRNYLINLGALIATTQILPALQISGGVRGFLTGAFAFMMANFLLVPLIKILLLPLNLLTLGLFAWLSNVLALYLLVAVIPNIQLIPYNFPGVTIEGFIIPAVTLSAFQVAIAVSFIIGLIIHFVQWIIK